MNAIKAHCPACGQHIEYPPEQGGTTIPCPSCSQSLNLPAPLPGRTRRRSWAKIIAWTLVALMAPMIGAGAVWLWVNRETLAPIVGMTGASIVMVGIGVLMLTFVAVVIFLWLIFPVFVFTKMDRIISLLETAARKDR